MKTWHAVALGLASVFGAVYAQKIKDPALKDATLGAIAIIASAGAVKNSNTDPNGNPLIPVDSKTYVTGVDPLKK